MTCSGLVGSGLGLPRGTAGAGPLQPDFICAEQSSPPGMTSCHLSWRLGLCPPTGIWAAKSRPDHTDRRQAWPNVPVTIGNLPVREVSMLVGQVAERSGPAVHRTVVVVDVEGFGDRHRTSAHQVVVRAGLYQVLRQAFEHAGVSWADCDHEDRGTVSWPDPDQPCSQGNDCSGIKSRVPVRGTSTCSRGRLDGHVPRDHARGTRPRSRGDDRVADREERCPAGTSPACAGTTYLRRQLRSDGERTHHRCCQPLSSATGCGDPALSNRACAAR